MAPEPQETPLPPSEWFVEAFRADYLDLYSHRNREDAARGVAFVRDLLSEPTLPDGPMLDCCCGAGRHLVQLRDAGLPAVGIDLSEDLLRHGLGEQQGGVFPVARADMRQLPFDDGAFASAVSLFTSFGYFEDQTDDRSVLAEIARVVTTDGLYLIDFLNAPAVRAGLVPHSERDLPGGQRLIEDRRIDEAANRVIKHARREWPDGSRREWTESVRLYGADAMELMLTDVDLEPIQRFGDFDRTRHHDASPRLIVIARRVR